MACLRFISDGESSQRFTDSVNFSCFVLNKLTHFIGITVRKTRGDGTGTWCDVSGSVSSCDSECQLNHDRV